MIRKTIIALLSLLLSVGVTLLIKPHFETYIKSELVLSIFLVVFTIIGCMALYPIIKRK